MPALLSIPEAAKELKLHPSRVRALASAGSLPAVKIGHRWAVDRSAVAEHWRRLHAVGRPFEPGNAWALLFLASGRDADWLDPSSHWRLRQALARDGLVGLAPRLDRRGSPRRFRVHPGEIRYLLEDPRLVRSGISAVSEHDLGLVSGQEADGYIRENDLADLQREHAMQPAELVEGNVLVRVLPDKAWHFVDERVAPLAAVALDLAEDPDPRSRRAGQARLKAIDAQLRSRPSSKFT